MEKFLEKQVAIVTGGSGGIGSAIAAALMENGARVVLAARTERSLAEKVDVLQRIHPEVFSNVCDVTRQQDIVRLVDETLSRWGQIDLLVNSAGMARRGSVHRFSEKDWDSMMAVNLKGAFLCAQKVIPTMKRQKRGWIINIASYAGKVGIAGSGAYCASKFGLVGLTQTLSEEGEAHNIKAATISPAYVNTSMHSKPPVPAAEMIQPSDVANAVLFLLKLSGFAIVKEIVIERKEGLAPST
jgi:NAD(P)-dependent dehydrogenase (short-subunit alcohol dehydrogenase family)